VHAGGPVPGDIVAGKYQIERVLGAGGMGIVLSAVHLHLQERVAIKMLSPELVLQGDAVRRFLREARAACRIKSEHVARVSDVGAFESGAPYLVMEYLEGQDLAQWLAENGRSKVEEAVGFVLQASEAIAEAHALGIVHRDLKPANLFLTRRFEGTPWIKVLDFGISKLNQGLTTGANAALTDSAAVMGSPLYMSPEQLRGARGVDQRADIWGIGVILYELLSARPPFSGETLPEVSVKIAVDRPDSLRELRRDVPAALEAAIFKCLEKDPQRRFQNVADLARALEPFGGDGALASAARIRRIVDSGKRAQRESTEPKRHSVDSLALAVRTTTTRWRRHGVAVTGAALVIGLFLGNLRRCASGEDEPAVASVTPGVGSPESAPAVSGPRAAHPSDAPLVVPVESIVPTASPSDSAAEATPPGAQEPISRATLAVAPRPADSKLGALVTQAVELRARGGSYVLIDGRPLGATPVKTNIRAGDHVAKFVHEGRTASRSFTVKPGEQLTLEVGPEDFEIVNPYRSGSGLERSSASPAPAEPPPFDRAAATASVRQMAERARTCARPNGPSGTAVVRVTFAPSGRVSSAIVSGALADSPVGDCVATVFRALSVQPFSGPAKTLATSVPLM
jgi:eukaryotic-like serine/threonine-protein kinase